MKSNIEIYLRLKPLIDNNNDNTKNSKSKMIKYEIEENNNKNKIYLQIPNEYNHQGYINNFKKSYEFTL